MSMSYSVFRLLSAIQIRSKMNLTSDHFFCPVPFNKIITQIKFGETHN